MQSVSHAPKLTKQCRFPLVWELVARILLFLNPIDIILMRKVSRDIYKVTTSRHVWVAALERICEVHGLFKPTYPLDKMSLSELEYAALAPYRFVKTVKEHQYDRNIPARYQTRIAQLCQPGPCVQKHSLESMLLVPGGRFCFTTEQKKLYLWDFGYGPQKLIKPFPLATLKIPLLGPESVTSTFDGNELILAVMAAGSQIKDALRIYRVDPRSKTPSFHLQTELLDVPTGRVFFTSENTVVLFSNKVVAIWNWVENTGVRWKAPIARGYSNIYSCDSSFIAYDEERTLRVWDYPALLPLPHSLQYSDILAVPNEPKYSIELPNCESSEHFIVSRYLSLSGTPRSQQGTLLERYLCAMVDREKELDQFQERVALSLFSIRDSVSVKSDAFIHTAIPVLCGVAENIFGGGEAYHSKNPSPLFTCDGHLVFCSESDASSIVAAVLPLPEDPDEGIQTLLMSLTTPDYRRKWGTILYGFCPMSGRLVYCHTEDSVEGQVCIADLLTPSPDMYEWDM